MRAELHIEFFSSSRDMIPEGMTGFTDNYMMAAAKDLICYNQSIEPGSTNTSIFKGCS